MRPAAPSDRALQTSPRGAFEYLPQSDPPILSVLGGVRGPGWFPKLRDESQWHGTLYPLNTDLKCYDYDHHLSSKTPADLRRLHLLHVEYLRFALCIAAGEYVPYELAEKHESLCTRASMEMHLVRKEPVW